MLLYKQKKNQNAKGNRLLINISVLGSPGPIRVVVFEENRVSSVIETALKSYTREGRRPVVRSDDLKDFVLYCPHAGSHALTPRETIGSQGARNFMLCKKPPSLENAEEVKATDFPSREGNSESWKSWFNKLINVKISSH